MHESYYKLLQEIPASAESKHRLTVVLQVVAGKLTMEEACRQLQLEEEEYIEIHDEVIRSMLKAAENSILEDKVAREMPNADEQS
jgi:hypothetical protein